MRTYLFNIIPRIQKFSKDLDNLTQLINQHWVSIDEINNSKTVYIFRDNNELLISTNGKIKKEKWEYLGNKSLIIDISSECYLFKHGFFDENILALKLDSVEEYAVFVNESKYNGDLNSINKVFDFLHSKYIDINIISKKHDSNLGYTNPDTKTKKKVGYNTDKGYIELDPFINMTGTKAYKNGIAAPDGIYKIGFMNTFTVENGIVIRS